jgi:hypothetical protein
MAQIWDARPDSWTEVGRVSYLINKASDLFYIGLIKRLITCSYHIKLNITSGLGKPLKIRIEGRTKRIETSLGGDGHTAESYIASYPGPLSHLPSRLEYESNTSNSIRALDANVEQDGSQSFRSYFACQLFRTYPGHHLNLLAWRKGSLRVAVTAFEKRLP